MWTSMVWPPLTTRHTAGARSGPCSIALARMWPSRWFTPISGARVASAIDLAAATPTRSAPTRPGPTVTAIPSSSSNPSPVSSSACSRSGFRASTWARLASSGTTPPKRSCTSTWLASRFARTTPSWTIATPVSSQEVSMPRTRTWLLASNALGADALGQLVDELGQAAAVARVADLIEPHDQRILADLLVVVLAYTHRAEPEPPVEPLCPPVRHAHLERDRLGADRDRLDDQIVEQTRGDLLPVAQRVHGDVRDVRLLAVADHPAVADDLSVDPRDEVAAVLGLGHLGQEQGGAPRTREDLPLDRHHTPKVATAHPGHLKPRRLGLADPKRSPHPSSSGRAAPHPSAGRSPPG